MELEILAYLGAALMVVLAYVAYQYFRSSALSARRMQGSHAKVVVSPPAVSEPIPPLPHESAAGTDETAEGAARAPEEPSLPIPAGSAANNDQSDETEPASVEVEETSGEEAALHSEDRPIEDIETLSVSSLADESTGSSAVLLQRLEAELASLPTGIELMDLPILERRRVADRREQLLDQRVRLLQHKQQGILRRKDRRRGSPSSG